MKYERVLIRAWIPYAIFFLMWEIWSMYFKLESREIPRKDEQGLGEIECEPKVKEGKDAEYFWCDENTTNLVLDALIVNKLALHQLETFFKSVLSLSTRSEMLLSEVNMVVSSAYKMELVEDRQLGRSLI